MPDVVTIQAPAKLNLALAVGPPGAGGMHPICSWMVTVDLYDDLEVRRLPADRFSRYAILWHEDARRRSEIDWSVTKDLAVRAHLALEKRAGRPLPVQMKLEKRIPVGGGLGGGSSDAAAMLHAINELYDLGLGLDELAGIAHTLGSDVPFLIGGGSALVEGLGERLTRHDQTPELHAVVVFPDAFCPTGRVYGLFDDEDPGPLRVDDVLALTAGMPGSPAADGVFNDLANAAVRTAPELEEILARLSELAERPAHVSGSGSSVFVLCDDALHAQFLAEAVEKEQQLPAVAVQAVPGRGRESGFADG
jgi:4-diphosphocytidyl-2-C-methyl-D-erythritol kinase